MLGHLPKVIAPTLSKAEHKLPTIRGCALSFLYFTLGAEDRTQELGMSLAQACDHQLGVSSLADATPIIFVIDDDVSVRNSLAESICREGWQVETFASAQEFLARTRPLVPSCLVFAISLPDLNGLEVQRQLSRERTELSIVVISGNADVPMTVQAMKAGAID